MVKSYLRFEFSKAFGTVLSSTSNLIWTSSHGKGSTGAGRAIVAANEEVIVWDVKKGEMLHRWRDDRCAAQVTAIAQSLTDPDLFAVGYEDGSIRLWDSATTTPIVNFNGHKSAVTVVSFDRSGVRLASGSKDTDIIIWDLVAEVGQYKLRGHKDQVTGLRFVEPVVDAGAGAGAGAGAAGSGDMSMHVEAPSGEDWLLTTGKDSLVKLWDLTTRYCVETHVTQTNGECWALGTSPDCRTCITAATDGELKVWSLNTESLLDSRHAVEAPISAKYLEDKGSFVRQHSDKATEILFHPTRDFFIVHGNEKSFEIWRKRSEAEIKKSQARKRRRKREKAKEAGMVEDDVEENPGAEDASKADITDVYQPYTLVRTGGKVKSVSWAADYLPKSLQVLVGTSNNQLELYAIDLPRKDNSNANGTAEYSLSVSVELPGHRTDVRAMALSSDDKMVATASHGTLKVWNVATQACIRTFECGYALSCAFLPGDQIIVVGTKSGALQVFDVISATVESIPAHEGPIYGLDVHPGGTSLATGSGDNTVKFWDLKIVKEVAPDTDQEVPRLRIVMRSKVLKVADEILTIRFSPDAKYLAVALLDHTVKVFFVDSLKMYLNLYGHKLPVISMDISYDSKLIVTSSADKTIRIWGLDFGDCHRSLLKHTDSIMQVLFVPHNSQGNGHHFFSASKDKSIRYWDGDKFQHIQRLAGHHGEVWALAIARSGGFVVSAAHDKSIRIWNETEEQLFLEEEREKELEELYESTLTQALQQDEDMLDQEGADGENANAVAAASKQTAETLTAGERIQEALAWGLEDLQVLQDWEEQKKVNPSLAPPQRHIIFMAQGISAETYVMNVLSKIRAAMLPDALRILSFSDLPALFTFLEIFARRGMNVVLTCRILFFMLKTHHRQIVGAQTMRDALEGVQEALRAQLAAQRDLIGFNLAALRTIGRRLEEKGVRNYVDEEWEAAEAKRKAASVKKREFVKIS